MHRNMTYPLFFTLCQNNISDASEIISSDDIQKLNVEQQKAILLLTVQHYLSKGNDIDFSKKNITLPYNIIYDRQANETIFDMTKLPKELLVILKKFTTIVFSQQNLNEVEMK